MNRSGTRDFVFDGEPARVHALDAIIAALTDEGLDPGQYQLAGEPTVSPVVGIEVVDGSVTAVTYDRVTTTYRVSPLPVVAR